MDIPSLSTTFLTISPTKTFISAVWPNFRKNLVEKAMIKALKIPKGLGSSS